MTHKQDVKYRFNKLADFKMPEEKNDKKKEKQGAEKEEAVFETQNIHENVTLTENEPKPKPKREKAETNNNKKIKSKSQSADDKPEEIIHTALESPLESSTNVGKQKHPDTIEQKKTEFAPREIKSPTHNHPDSQKAESLKKSKHMTINDFPKDEKPREKMLAYGADVLSNAELLAMIIGSGTKSNEKSLTAIELSRKILKHFGEDLTELRAASAEELYRDDDLSGIGMAKACKIKAALELGHRANMSKKTLLKISSSRDAADYLMPDMKNLKQEEFVVLLLDSKNHLIKKERVSKGTVNASLVTPREVFAFAVRQHATGIIVAHNHPSGDPTPSQADKSVTRELIESGKILNIPLLDHIIIGNDYFSFLEEGILY